jgi:Fe/S biogenesis protein NfuA
VDDAPGTEGGAGSAPLITVTPQALRKVQQIRADEPDGDRLALWLEVSGAAAGEYTYDVYFDVAEAAAARTPSCTTTTSPWSSRPAAWTGWRGRPSACPATCSTPACRSRTRTDRRRRRRRARRWAPPGAPPVGDLSGDVAQRILQVLERQINPSIASHGGRADLVAVEDETAYLRLSGGCQGCGMASVTLGQGIEVAIKDNVPEITDVVDVTDHAQGANPYYEAAKK